MEDRLGHYSLRIKEFQAKEWMGSTVYFEVLVLIGVPSGNVVGVW